MSKPIDSISNRIKKAMALRNIQPVDLCKSTGIPKASISQYMSGYVQPKQDRLFLMAKALGVSEAWLMGYDVSMERKNIYSDDNAKLVSQIRNDVALSELLKKYFLLSDSEKEKVLSMLNILLS